MVVQAVLAGVGLCCGTYQIEYVALHIAEWLCSKRKDMVIMFKELFYKPQPDYPTPSVYGEERNKGPDYTPVCLDNIPGFTVGTIIGSYPQKLVGIPQGKEGNSLVVGANGSGKSQCIAKTTLLTWHGAIMALDIKGELYAYYSKLYKFGKVKRKPIQFDPTCKNGICYDPFQGIIPGSDEVTELMCEIAMAMHPPDANERDSYWRDTERNILTAALICYHDIGLSFVETIEIVASSPIAKLCNDIKNSGNENAMMFIGDLSNCNPENLASFSSGLRNDLSLLASNPYFSKAFCSNDEGSGCFGWRDLENCNIFIRIPEDNIEQWSIPVRIIVTQLFRYLMRRPDMHSKKGRKNIQTLLLLDEFARFGNIDLITEAIATLRSKKVNICIVLQSLAQLDKIYGVENRRIICDNCQYKVIFNVYDVDTQKYFSELIGTTVNTKEDHTDIKDTCGYSDRCHSNNRDPVIYPHEFATLNKILFHTPHGFYRLDKITPEEIFPSELYITAPNIARIRAISSKMIKDGVIKM